MLFNIKVSQQRIYSKEENKKVKPEAINSFGWNNYYELLLVIS